MGILLSRAVKGKRFTGDEEGFSMVNGEISDVEELPARQCEMAGEIQV